MRPEQRATIQTSMRGEGLPRELRASFKKCIHPLKSMQGSIAEANGADELMRLEFPDYEAIYKRITALPKSK